MSHFAREGSPPSVTSEASTVPAPNPSAQVAVLVKAVPMANTPPPPVPSALTSSRENREGSTRHCRTTKVAFGPGAPALDPSTDVHAREVEVVVPVEGTVAAQGSRYLPHGCAGSRRQEVSEGGSCSSVERPHVCVGEGAGGVCVCVTCAPPPPHPHFTQRTHLGGDDPASIRDTALTAPFTGSTTVHRAEGGEEGAGDCRGAANTSPPHVISTKVVVVEEELLVPGVDRVQSSVTFVPTTTSATARPSSNMNATISAADVQVCRGWVGLEVGGGHGAHNC
jgi:hypothetical protein